MLHEIGHVLGLDHSQLDYAVMWESQNPYRDWQQRDALGVDDIVGAQVLYGSRPIAALLKVDSLGAGWRYSDDVSVTSDRDDYYGFILVRPHTIKINLRPTGGDADVVLLDSAGTELTRSALAGTQVDMIERPLPAGLYIIRVDAYAGRSDYHLDLWNMDGRSLSRAYSLGDLSYDPIGLRNVAWTDTVNQVNNNDDYFSFVLEKSTQLQFDLTGLDGNARLNLLDQSGTEIAFANSSAAFGYSIDEWLSAGTYHLHVKYIGAGRGRSLERTVDTRTSHSTDYTLVYTRLGEFPPPSAIDLGDLTNQASLGSSRGTVSFNNDAYFRFTLTALTTIRFELGDLSADADLYLLNSSGDEIAQSVYGGTVEDSIDRELAAGTYYVRVEPLFYGVATDYNLRYRTVGDLGDLTSQAAARTVTGMVDGSGNDNHFRFTLTQTQTMRFELKDLSGDANLFLSDSSGTEIARSVLRGDADEFVIQSLEPGTYRVRVVTREDEAIDYSLRYSRVVGLGDLAGQTSEQTSSGAVNNTDGDNDYYRFSLTQPSKVRFVLGDLNADADLYLLASSGVEIAGSAASGTQDDAFRRYLGTGTYYVRVDPYGTGTINYNLRYSRTNGLPETGVVQLGDLTSQASEQTSTGTVNQEDDYFGFSLTRPAQMRLELNDLSADADLFLLDSSGTQVAGSVLGGTADDSIVRWLAPGAYYVTVDPYGTGTIDYSFVYSREDGLPADVIQLGDLTSQSSAQVSSGTAGGTDGDDYFSFSVNQLTSMRFELQNLSGDADLLLLDASGTEIARSELGGTESELLNRSLGAGDYYVRVDAPDSDTIDYDLRYSREFELGDLTSQESPETHSDDVTQAVNDIFRFSLTWPTEMYFELKNLSADADLFLLDSSGIELDRSELGGTASDTISRLLTPGTYYVRVDAYDAGTIDYNLRYRREGGLPDVSLVDLGDLTSQTSARTSSGTVDRTDNDKDYFRFTLTEESVMGFTLNGLSADADLYLLNYSHEEIARSQLGGTENESIVRELGPGTYYVSVNAYDTGAIDYTLRYNPDESISVELEARRNALAAELAALEAQEGLEAEVERATLEAELAAARAALAEIQGADLPEDRVDLGDLTGQVSAQEASGSASGTVDDPYFRFTLTGPSRMRLELTDLSADADLYLTGVSDVETQLANSELAGTADESIVRWLGAGTYHVRIIPFDSGTIDYTLGYSRQDMLPTAGTTKLGDLTDQSTAQTFSGAVSQVGNDDDYLRFTLTQSSTVNLELTGLSGNADLYLLSSSGEEIARSELDGTQQDEISQLLGTGTYYVHVDANGSGTINYNLRYSSTQDTGQDTATATATPLDVVSSPPEPGQTPQTATGLGSLITSDTPAGEDIRPLWRPQGTSTDTTPWHDENRYLIRPSGMLAG